MKEQINNKKKNNIPVEVNNDIDDNEIKIDEINTLNILFKSLNEIKGNYSKDKNKLKEDDNIKKYLMINIINKNITYPIQLEYYANNPKEDLLWKTIKRLKEEKKTDLFNLQKENNFLKKTLDNKRQLGAVENENYKIKYDKLLEEFNLFKEKNKKRKC